MHFRHKIAYFARKDPAGRRCILKYQGKLNANTNTLQTYTNTAKLDFGPTAKRDSRSNSAYVYSGHISFYKKDNSGNDLAGAKFVVKNKDGKYAKLTGSGVSYSFVAWVDDKEAATVITTTGAATEITVRGLAAGTYTLVGTTTPARRPGEIWSFWATATAPISAVSGPSSPARRWN